MFCQTTTSRACSQHASVYPLPICHPQWHVECVWQPQNDPFLHTVSVKTTGAQTSSHTKTHAWLTRQQRETPDGCENTQKTRQRIINKRFYVFLPGCWHNPEDVGRNMERKKNKIQSEDIDKVDNMYWHKLFFRILFLLNKEKRVDPFIH